MLEADLKANVIRVYQPTAIEYVISNFDFKKVAAVMKLMDWKWHDRTEPYLPTEDDLRLAARQYLAEAMENGRKAGYKLSLSGAGGFQAMYHVAEWNGNKEELILSFQLANARY